MTPEQLKNLESKFGVALPGDYRELLLDYPKDLPSVVSGYELLNNPKILEDENQSVRAGLLWGTKWPKTYFVVGGDGSGTLFCIDTERSLSPVLCFDHEDQTFRVEAPSLAQWIPQLVALHG